MSKKIFITGISGFAGQHLARALVKNPENKVSGSYLSSNSLDSISDISSNLKLFNLDLLDFEAVLKVFKEEKIDEVYHLAAIASPADSFGHPDIVVNNNITSELNLLEAIRNTSQNPKIMIVSSAEVYGNVNPKDLPINEEAPLNPENPYAVSKIAQDFFGLQYFNSYGMNIFRVRPFNHIGPGQTDKFVTSSFAKKIAEIEKKKRDPILTVGNLNSKRDFTDVIDMINAYILLMEKGIAPQVYNIGSGKSYKISEILDILLSFSKETIKVQVDKNLLRPSDNKESVCDYSKVRNLTGWQPKIPIEESLKSVLEFWKSKV